MDDSANTLPVERVIDALRAHAAVVASDEEPPVVMPVVNELRAAALAYVNSVREMSGWGNVFADLHDEDDDEDWEDDDESVVEDGIQRLSVRSRQDFLVRDAEALQAFAAQRMREKDPGAADADAVEHTDSPAAALDVLLAMDPLDYPGLEMAGGGWYIDPVEKTLYEMSADERVDVGF